MDSDREEMLYLHTLKMVLWDEDVERVYALPFQRLENETDLEYTIS